VWLEYCKSYDEQKLLVETYLEDPVDVRMPEGRPPHAEDLHTCGKTHFLKVWRQHQLTRHITLRKYMRFSKCDTCVTCRSRLPSWTLDVIVEAKRRKVLYDEHLVFSFSFYFRLSNYLFYLTFPF
jgi:hypothetical protein